MIDTWIELRISPRTAVLFKSLRRQLFDLLESRIAHLPAASVDDATEAQADVYGGMPTAAAHPSSAPSSAGTPAAGSSRPSVARAPQPGGPGWPPPMESKEEAQEAILASLVYVIGKGMELQADELAASALAAGKKPPARR